MRRAGADDLVFESDRRMSVKRFLAGLLLGMLMLSACGSGDDQADGTPGESFAETTPMADVQLDESLIGPEELGVQLGVASRTNPLIWPLSGVADGQRHFSQQLVDASGEYVGWVSIFLFDSQADLQEAFSQVAQNVAGQEHPEIAPVGEQSVAYDENGRHGVALVACHALLNVYASRSIDLGRLAGYGEALAGRLPEGVCP